MRYQLDVKPKVREYLRSLEFQTREGLIRFLAGVNAVAELPESFRTDPANRAAPESRYFLYRYVFQDGNRLPVLTLAVDDSSAVYGVLTIDYADCS